MKSTGRGKAGRRGNGEKRKRERQEEKVKRGSGGEAATTLLTLDIKRRGEALRGRVRAAPFLVSTGSHVHTLPVTSLTGAGQSICERVFPLMDECRAGVLY